MLSVRPPSCFVLLAAVVILAMPSLARAADCNGNGVDDAQEIATGTSSDCNGNLRPDECDLVPGPDTHDLSPNLAIPDNYPTGVSSTITVPGSGVVTDLNVALHIDHTFQGDLVVTLSHAGVTRTLIQHAGLCAEPIYGYDADNFGSAGALLVLDDDAAVGIDCYAGTSSGGIDNFAGPAGPNQALAAFNGLDRGGPWTLTVADFVGSDFGTLVTWRLDFAGTFTFSEDCNANLVPDECDFTPTVRTYGISPNLSIPDLDWNGMASTINVPDSGEVGDLEVALHIDHGGQGDLYVELWHAGISRPLISRPGLCSDSFYGYSAADFGSAGALLVLDDDAGTAIDCYAGSSSSGINNYAGPAQPSHRLSDFDSLDRAGDWTLHVYDFSYFGTGTLVTWELRMPTSSSDCNTNGVPDECDVGAGSPDCNANGRPDECDLVETFTAEYAQTPNVSIPDGWSSVSSTIVVPDSGPIDDLNIGLFISHSYQGDLQATLSHAGVTITLIDRPGRCVDSTYGYSANDFGSTGNWLVLDDSAAALLACYSGGGPSIDGYAGPASPSQPLAAFSGLDRAGEWTLTVSDAELYETGTLISWRLDLEALGGDNDCNTNIIPDECDEDCNANDTPDECDLGAMVTEAYTLSPNLGIPDGHPSGVSSTMTVPDAGTIADLDLGLHISHSWQGDLTVTLSHDGVTATLIDRPGLCFNPSYGYGADHFGTMNGLLIHDDSAATGIDCYDGPFSPGIDNYAGPARPTQPLAAFEGLDRAGEWTLTVSDHVFTDAGSLVSWELRLGSYAFEDCHDDGVLDECQQGDCDSDGDLDLNDFPQWEGCMNGPDVGPAGPSCACVELDCDTDVDLADFADFQVAFTGP